MFYKIYLFVGLVLFIYELKFIKVNYKTFCVYDNPITVTFIHYFIRFIWNVLFWPLRILIRLVKQI